MEPLAYRSKMPVEYVLLTTPCDADAKAFLRKFHKVALALGTSASFTPHEYVFDGVKAGCQGPNPPEYCPYLCTNNGRYCALDPDKDIHSGISGADVVAESLRRLCIWDAYGSDGLGKEWWEYVTAFSNKCDATSKPTETFISPTCIQQAMTTAHIDSEIIDRCMKQSGGLQDNVDNSMFENQRSSWRWMLVSVPALYIHELPIEVFSFQTAFMTICEAFDDPAQKPEICQNCMSCFSMEACVEHGSCPSFTTVASSSLWRPSRASLTTSTTTTTTTTTTEELTSSAATDGSSSTSVLSGFFGVLTLVFAVTFALTFAIVGLLIRQRRRQQRTNSRKQQYMACRDSKNFTAQDTLLEVDPEDYGMQLTIIDEDQHEKDSSSREYMNQRILKRDKSGEESTLRKLMVVCETSVAEERIARKESILH